MRKTEIVTGTLVDDRTVALDKPVPLRPMKVRVVIEPLDDKHTRRYRPEIISEIYAAQAARGHHPPSREEVDRRIESERDSWGD
ncbi:MAG TPA: hypothetical protein VIE89_11875 [Candidatus Binatia bacterium]|jgi:hypothetical protein